MLDKTALPGRALRFGALALLALAGCLILVAAVYGMIRLRHLSTIQVELGKLQAEQRSLIGQRDEELSQIYWRLDEIERSLFGHVLARLNEQRPRSAPVQPWQRNRDEELRERIRRLEQWRLKQDGK